MIGLSVVVKDILCDVVASDIEEKIQDTVVVPVRNTCKSNQCKTFISNRTHYLLR